MDNTRNKTIGAIFDEYEHDDASDLIDIEDTYGTEEEAAKYNIWDGEKLVSQEEWEIAQKIKKNQGDLDEEE